MTYIYFLRSLATASAATNSDIPFIRLYVSFKDPFLRHLTKPHQGFMLIGAHEMKFTPDLTGANLE
jgi:hypothetical protein